MKKLLSKVKVNQLICVFSDVSNSNVNQQGNAPLAMGRGAKLNLAEGTQRVRSGPGERGREAVSDQSSISFVMYGVLAIALPGWDQTSACVESNIMFLAGCPL